MKECSFQPKLNNYACIPRYPKMGQQPGALRNQIPLHERVDLVQKEK